MARPIPVLNLYYMFCYAWNLFEEGKELAAGAADAGTLRELVAHVMEAAVRRLLRRGLDQGYGERTDQLTVLRGTVDVPGSIPLQARRSPALRCRFDERTPDVLHNRIVKAALRRLLALAGLPQPIRARLGLLLPAFAAVGDIPLRPAVFAGVQLYRHNAGYGFLLHLCRMVMDATIPEQTGVQSRFRDIANDEAAMRNVFEAFVRNLLEREQHAFEVTRPRLKWDTGDAPASGKLPGMQLDMLLSSPTRRIIVDTKYTLAATQIYRERESLRSGHLYQLFAYLRSAAVTHGHAEGVLLYPADGHVEEHRDTVQGHSIRVMTVDLLQDWQAIKTAILAVAA